MRVRSPFASGNEEINCVFKQLEIILFFTIAKEKRSTIETKEVVRSREDFECLLTVLNNNSALMTLYEYG
jgi:hypothetical protein